MTIIDIRLMSWFARLQLAQAAAGNSVVPTISALFLLLFYFSAIFVSHRSLLDLKRFLFREMTYCSYYHRIWEVPSCPLRCYIVGGEEVPQVPLGCYSIEFLPFFLSFPL